MKKILFSVLILCIGLSAMILPASAKNTRMCIRDCDYIQRELEVVAGFDMLPIMDIAGELGYNVYREKNRLWLYRGNHSFVFNIGNAAVYDENGKWYGLDVTPRIINGKYMIPAKFIYTVLGDTYTWDDVTKTLFIGSDRTYNWLITTDEYKGAQLWKKLPSSYVYASGAGGWSEFLTLNSDGSFVGDFYDDCYFYDGLFYEAVCEYNGKFTTPRKIDDYSYSTSVEYLNVHQRVGMTYKKAGSQYDCVCVSPLGMRKNSEIIIYLPGTKVSQMPEMARVILQVYLENNPYYIPYDTYVLYNVDLNSAFVGDLN